ncbi:MAG: hypothetical protein J0L53_02150 [Spirochaetes bacterium]|nr:hypothetical protein [Spirochaetota bacterium]
MKKNIFRSVLAVFFAMGLTSQVSAIGVGGWVGYNLATGIDLSGCESLKGTSGECSKGGIAVGGDLWLFSLPAMPIKFGVGAAYVPVSYQKYVGGTVGGGSGSSSFYTVEYKTGFIPVYAEARADFMGFFGGVTVGYNISTSTASTSTSANSVVVTAASGNFGVGGFAGYGIGLGPVKIEAGLRLFSAGSASNLTPFVGAQISL